jgi:hypothetical protein
MDARRDICATLARDVAGLCPRRLVRQVSPTYLFLVNFGEFMRSQLETR